MRDLLLKYVSLFCALIFPAIAAAHPHHEQAYENNINGEIEHVFDHAAALANAQSAAYAVDSRGMPILNSYAPARGVIYLDFDGGRFSGNDFGAYDRDGDATTFNAQEQAEIYNAWKDVSTHFAMFDINVTTVAPDKTLTPTAHSLISNDKQGGSANTNKFGNTSDGARSANASSNARSRTTGITHEIGHIMGLGHQDEYEIYEEGQPRTRSYRRVDPVTDIAPIMGVDFAGKFSSWQEGFKNDPAVPQSDLEVIAASIIREYNDFFPDDPYTGDGFRPDEHGNTMGSATAANLSYSQIDETSWDATALIEGIIERNGFGDPDDDGDVDMFRFNWGGGELVIDAEAIKNVAASPDYASSLGIDLTLYDEDGQVVAQTLATSENDTQSLLGFESGELGSLDAGTYYLEVSPDGGYDDVGAYTLAFEGVSAVPEPTSMILLGLGGLCFLRRRR